MDMAGAKRAALAVLCELMWNDEIELDAALSLRTYLTREDLGADKIAQAVQSFLPHPQAETVLQRMQLKLDAFERLEAAP